MLSIGLGLTGIRKTFAPTDITGCVLWLRSDLGITLNGSTVSAWADQSSNANTAIQGTAANQPAYNAAAINGNYELAFDGTNDHLAITPAAALTGAKNWTLLVALKPDVTTGSRAAFAVGTTGAGYAFAVNANAAAKREVFMSGVGVVSDGAAATTWELWSSSRDNGGLPVTSFWLNGASQSLDSNPTTAAPSVAAFVGSLSAATLFWKGRIAEIILYNVELSATARRSIEAYLGNRYAITVT